MKYFEVSYRMEHSMFVTKCSTIYDTANAISDIAKYDVRFEYDHIDLDGFIERLVLMSNGELISSSYRFITVRYVESEVTNGWYEGWGSSPTIRAESV